MTLPAPLAPPPPRGPDPQQIDALRVVVGKLILAFPIAGGEPARDIAEAYVAVLAELPVGAVAEACDRFMKGKVERRSAGLRPGADLVYDLARQIAAKRDRAAQRALPPPAPPPRRPAIGRALSELAAELGGASGPLPAKESPGAALVRAFREARRDGEAADGAARA